MNEAEKINMRKTLKSTVPVYFYNCCNCEEVFVLSYTHNCKRNYNLRMNISQVAATSIKSVDRPESGTIG
jgi:hypothetical protein